MWTIRQGSNLESTAGQTSPVSCSECSKHLDMYYTCYVYLDVMNRITSLDNWIKTNGAVGLT